MGSRKVFSGTRVSKGNEIQCWMNVNNELFIECGNLYEGYESGFVSLDIETSLELIQELQLCVDKMRENDSEEEKNIPTK